jgi:2-phosphoglycerate kinase
MSRVLIINPAEQTRVPFLRGIMVHSLQDAGLGFKQAHQLASEVREEISDESTLTTVELQQRVMDKLKQLEHPACLERYEKRSLPRVIQVERRDGQIIEFSPTEYRHNLEAIGLKSGEALEIVQTVNNHLVKRNTSRVTSRYIAYFTYRLLRMSKSRGPAVAKRWLIWRDFIDSGRPLVFLLAGTAGSGKSTVAADLASRLNIVRTQSTDMLREVLRSIISSKVQPLLHESSFTAWTKLPESKKQQANTEELLVEGYCNQADILSTAIDAVMQRASREGVSLIVEGVHLHPGNIDEWVAIEDALVVPVMLAVLKPKNLRSRISGRSSDVPQRRSKRYLDYFDSIWALQSYLLSEADQSGITIIVNGDRDHVFREIMLATIDKLAENFDKTPEQVFGSVHKAMVEEGFDYQV